MLTLLTCVMTAGAVLLCIPVVVLAMEILAAIVLKERAPLDDCPPRSRLAVLIPAHNESEGLRPTVADVRAQLRPGDRVLVVADNCTDDTATIARSAGAEVVERHDPARLSKGFALDHGLRHLESDPPEIVIVVDADCRLAVDTLDWLAKSCMTTGRPTQALYRMEVASDAKGAAKQRVALFAWIVKTYVRPMGLANLGLPCQLMGTGMAFPWEAIRSVELASSNLVEDLKLGLDLAAAGMAPRLCHHTHIESTFPISESARFAQRQRWERGSLLTVIRNVPAFLWKALVTVNLPLFVLVLDALVPPLTFFTVVLIVSLLVSVVAAIAGITAAPLIIIAVALILFTGTIVSAWAVYARNILRVGDAGRLVAHFIQTLRIYRHHNGRWIRTDRQ